MFPHRRKYTQTRQILTAFFKIKKTYGKAQALSGIKCLTKLAILALPRRRKKQGRGKGSQSVEMGRGKREKEKGWVERKKEKKTRFFHACQGTLRDQRKRGDTLSSSSSILPRFLCFREKNMTCFSGDVMVSQLSPPPHISLSLFSPPQPFLCCETLLPITQSFVKRGRQSFLAAMKNAVFAQKKSRQEKKISVSLSLLAIGL